MTDDTKLSPSTTDGDLFLRQIGELPAKAYNMISDLFANLAGRPPDRQNHIEVPQSTPAPPGIRPPPPSKSPTARWIVDSMSLVSARDEAAGDYMTGRTVIDTMKLKLELPPGYESDYPADATRTASPAEISAYVRSVDVIAKMKASAFHGTASASFAAENLRESLAQRRTALDALDLRGPRSSSKESWVEHLAAVTELKTLIISGQKELVAAEQEHVVADVEAKRVASLMWTVPDAGIVIRPVQGSTGSGQFY